jgi:hypothetical protein
LVGHWSLPLPLPLLINNHEASDFNSSLCFNLKERSFMDLIQSEGFRTIILTEMLFLVMISNAPSLFGCDHATLIDLIK